MDKFHNKDFTCCNTNKSECSSNDDFATCCNEEQHDDILCEEDVSDASSDALYELLKEKMKVRYEKKVGSKLDEIADIAVSLTIEHWKHEETSKKHRVEYEEKLKAAFKSISKV